MSCSHTDQTERGVRILAVCSQALGCVACQLLPERLSTYMALIIQFVVGQLQLVEADHLPHPSLPRGRRVRMNIHPGRHRGISIPCHHPLRAVVNIPARQRPNCQVWTNHTWNYQPRPSVHPFLNINLHLCAHNNF